MRVRPHLRAFVKSIPGSKQLASAGRRIISNIVFNRTLTIVGQNIVAPSIGGLSCKVTEPWMTELLQKLLNGVDGAFLDVGVNVGQTLVKVKALDWERAYYGFEPNPACVYYVSQLIRKNSFPNCQIAPVGLYTDDRLLPLISFSDNPGDPSASLIEGYKAHKSVRERKLVPVLRYEVAAASMEIERIGIVKIDVEGGELEVLHSLAKLIRQDRPIIAMEILPAYSGQNKIRVDRQKAIEEFFRDMEYSLYRIRKSTDDKYAGIESIESFGIHEDTSSCDYLMLPSENSAKLAALMTAPSPIRA